MGTNADPTQMEGLQTQDRETLDQLNLTVKTQSVQIEALSKALEQLMVQNTQMMETFQTVLKKPSQGDPTPNPATEASPNQSDGPLFAFKNPAARDLAKRVFSFPDESQLVGPSNWQAWKQALYIQFRALGIADFVKSPELAKNLSPEDQAVVLLLLRDSCGKGPREAITWHLCPVEAFAALTQNYCLPHDLERDSLYREFHALNFKQFKGSIGEFNSYFNSLVARLQLNQVDISAIDIQNQYLKALEGSFPTWAERLRSTIRSIKALGGSTDALNLQYLMADLLAEESNPISTVHKQAASYRANGNQNGSQKPKGKDNGSGNNKKDRKKNKSAKGKGKGGSESSEKNSDSSGSSTSDKKSKKSKDGAKSNSNEEGTTFVALNYNLFTGGFSGFNAHPGIVEENDDATSGVVDLESLSGSDTSDSSEGDSSDSEDSVTSDMPAAVHCTCCEHSNNSHSAANPSNSRGKRKAVLYDTGSTHHIFANRELFSSFSTNVELKIGTGGGPVYPKGVGTVTLDVQRSENPDDYEKLTLQNVLYIPSFDVNIISGILHYQSGGVLIKQSLFGSNRRCWGRLNFQRHGFFLRVKGHACPIISQQDPFGGFSHSSDGFMPRPELKVELSNVPPKDREEYARYYSDSEENMDIDNAEGPNSNAKKAVPRQLKKKASAGGNMPTSSAKRPNDSRAVEPRALDETLDNSSEGPIPEDTIAPKRGVSHTREPLSEPPLLGAVEAAPATIEHSPAGLKKTASGWISPEGDLVVGGDEELALKALLWHRRLGHIGLALLKKTCGIAKGLPNFTEIKGLQCTTCAKTVAVRRTRKSPLPDPDNVLDSIEGDTLEISPMPHNRRPVLLMLVDRKSRFRWVLLLPNKKGPTVSVAIKGFFRALKSRYGRYPRRFFFDGGKEVNTEIQDWLQRKGTSFGTSNPYNHGQNGLSERSIRVVLDRLRATINAAGLPHYLWCYIVAGVVGLVNATAVTNRELTPYQEFYDEVEPGSPHRPSLGHHRVIGTHCEAIIPLEKREKSKKLQPRTEAVRLLQALSASTVLVYAPKRRAVYKTSTIKILEGVPTENLAPEGELISEGVVEAKHLQTPDEAPVQGLKPEISVDPVDTDSEADLDFQKNDTPADYRDYPLPPSNNRPPEPVHPTVRPPDRPAVIAPPTRKIPELPVDKMPTDDGNLYQEPPDIDAMDVDALVNYICYKAQAKFPKKKPTKDGEPNSYREALKSADRTKWLAGLGAEFEQLLLKKTFWFLPKAKLPKGRRLITTRPVFKLKKDKHNNPVKYKVRLVAKGFLQVEGLDFTETFASTSIPPTWRILLALAAALDWEIEQIDFIGAFLNSDLDVEIYLSIPEGFAEWASTVNPQFQKVLQACGYNPKEEQIILLKRALYGLKQGPREWQNKLKTLLHGEGFQPLISDPAVFYNAKRKHFIITFVDDCLLIGPDIHYIQRLKKSLNKVYALDDRGPAAYFLGVQIVRDRPKRLLWIHQSQYIDEMLKTFGLEDSRFIGIPLQPGLLNNASGKPVTPSEIKLLQRIIGTVMYLMLLTRPDISFAVQWISRHLTTATTTHINAAKNLLRYLGGTRNLAICYGGSAKSVSIPERLKDTPVAKASKGLKLIGFSDSDFAGDREESKSTYGYLFILAGGPITWKCKRATTVACSTVEAETDALQEAIREAMWLRGLFSELERPVKGPIALFGDNTGSIANSKNPTQHKRTKHTLLKFHFVREKVLLGLVTIEYLDTKRMPADGLTKPLAPPVHRGFLELLGLRSAAQFLP
jgi:Reverse transcriptase (RNA-dependent DNA polymerase)./Integrase core domain.